MVRWFQTENSRIEKMGPEWLTFRLWDSKESINILFINNNDLDFYLLSHQILTFFLVNRDHKNRELEISRKTITFSLNFPHFKMGEENSVFITLWILIRNWHSDFLQKNGRTMRIKSTNYKFYSTEMTKTDLLRHPLKQKWSVKFLRLSKSNLSPGAWNLGSVSSGFLSTLIRH